jgi:anthranilate phosphoribosyltransferase
VWSRKLTIDIKQAISRVVDRVDLESADMETVMHQIMTGKATPIQIGGFLAGLRAKGETVAEIAAAAKVMRELATHVDAASENLVDTCGTGGDGLSIFNVSTASAFVVAAAGGRVAKHGNRSVSSSCGSADLLEAAGVNLDLSPQQVARCINEVGIGFLYAPAHHAAARYAAAPRKELGTRTLFNLLGPLTNPADAPNQLLGVFASRWVEPIAKVLHSLGSRHVLVVHAEDGLDEISIAAPTYVAELQDGQIRTYTIQPENFDISRQPLECLHVASAAESLALIQSAFNDQPGPARDMIVLNAGAALYAANVTENIGRGVGLARETIASGEVMHRMAMLVEVAR